MAGTELQPSPPGLTGAEAARRLRTSGANLVVTVSIGDFTDAVIIGLVVVANTAIGVVQEIRADRAIAALDDLAAPTARVVRDGDDLVVPAAELVRADAVRLEAGDVVPANLRLTVAHRLRLDESALTGESVAVGREAGEEAAAGTVVVAGRPPVSPSVPDRPAALAASPRSSPAPVQARHRCNAGSHRWDKCWASSLSRCPD